MTNKERRALQQRAATLLARAEREPSIILRGWFRQRAAEALARIAA